MCPTGLHCILSHRYLHALHGAIILSPLFKVWSFLEYFHAGVIETQKHLTH